MKKLLLLALVMLGGVMQANAEDINLHLVSNLSSTAWTTDDPGDAYKFNYHHDGTQEVYEYTVTSTMIGNQDFYFRINFWDNWGMLQPNQDSNKEYTFANGQWETLATKSGNGSAFKINHTSIKAASYKITVYRKLNEGAWVKAEIVSMPATVSSLGYSTFCCDRALDLDNASTGLTAYKASVNGGKVVLTKATGKVEAGTGLLLAGTTGTIPVVETSAASALSDNLLHGTVTKTNIAASTDGAYHYFLAGTTTANIGFYNLATAADCEAGKAYLETTSALSSDPASSRVAWIFADEATGIQNAQVQSNNNGLYFDLQGRRVAQPTKGLYIVNGKKVIK